MISSNVTCVSRWLPKGSCRKEYITVSDRRFHAESVACNHCGPSYYALYNKVKVTGYSELLNLSSRLLREGEVIAAEGIGGYYLICDARSEKAVSRLRDIKQRDGMPFAVLFRDIDIMRTLPLVCWNTD